MEQEPDKPNHPSPPFPGWLRPEQCGSAHNKPIEGLLKAYAEKRRQKAGKPLELHPATRTMLQGEVVRTFAKQVAETKSHPGFLKGFLPRFAVAGSLFAVLMAGVLLVLHIQKKPPEQLALAKNASQTSPSAAPTGVSPSEAEPMDFNRRESVDALALSGKSGDREFAAGGFAKQSATAAAPAASPGKSSEVAMDAVAKNDSTQRSGGRGAFGESAGQPSIRGFTANKAADMDKVHESTLALKESAPADRSELAQKDAASEEGRDKAGNQSFAEQSKSISRRMQFSQMARASAPSSVAKAEAKAGESERILASFQMEQNGDEIRIVDADGSVYTGKVEMVGLKPDSAAKSAPSAPQPLEGGSSSKRAASKGQVEKMKGVEMQKAEPQRRLGQLEPQQPGLEAGGKFSFRARGVNRTLNRVVELRGHFVTESSIQSEAASSTKKESAEAFHQTGHATRARVQGRAQIEGANEIEIDAVLIDSN